MYAFTNHFSSSPTLYQRIGMINQRRSGYLDLGRYLLSLFVIVIMTFGFQSCSDNFSSTYIQQNRKTLFSLIVSRTTDYQLDTLRQELAQRDITLAIDTVDRLANGQISRITLSIKPPRPGHPIHVTIGSSLSKSPIPVVGLQCNEQGCQLGFTNKLFPERLQTLAKRESTQLPVEFQENLAETVKGANAKFGLFNEFFRNDFLESTYFKMRSTGICMTPDFHLDLYPEYRKAILFIDGKEATRRELNEIHALDLKKVVIFSGKSAVMRLGNERAKNGLIMVYKLHNISIRDKYVSTDLLTEVYPALFPEN